MPFAALPTSEVPAGAAIYVVLRPDSQPPVFFDTNSGQAVRGRRHSVPISDFDAAWVPDAEVVYIGKADRGASGDRVLSKRLDEYRRYGADLGGNHNGGRYLSQLRNSEDLLVAWREETDVDARSTEA